jgi:ribonuclease P protein component
VSCGPALTLFGLANDVGSCRLGVTVTRKVGRAVTRNRIKRVLREIFRRNPDCRNESMDLVINANPSCTTRTREEIESEFDRALARLMRGAHR